MKSKDTIKPTILSIGGSVIIPDQGFDPVFLEQFRHLILEQVRQKKRRFILVIGGGAVCRTYQNTAAKFDQVNKTDLDWLGIRMTVINAHLLQLLFKGYVYPEIVTDSRKIIRTRKPVILAAGWKPGCSTDKDAILHAETYGATEVFNLTNTDYVYDKDPKRYKTAKKLENISWAYFRKKIVGEDWVPGKNAPFDPVASRLAERLGLRVSILRGTNLEAVKAALEGQPFPGTVIE